MPEVEGKWVAVPLRVRREQFERIERARGMVARERFLRELIDRGLCHREPPQTAEPAPGAR